MKPVFLIAWREYKQYVFSRGFLLFLLMFPIGVLAISGAMGLVERSKPIRTFVIYDGTGAYGEIIDAEIEKRFLFSALQSWDLYYETSLDPAARDDEVAPAPFVPAPVHQQRLDAFLAAGGFDRAVEISNRYRKPSAHPFAMPKRPYYRAALPAEIAAMEDVQAASEALRPYLLGERMVRGENNQGAELFAAVIIPENFGAAEDGDAAQYWSRNLTDQSLQETVSSALHTALRVDALERSGLDRSVLDQLTSVSAQMNAFRPDRSQEEAEIGTRDRIETVMPAALTYMLLVIIFGAGNLLLTNTIEERSNKIVEVLLSSVTADQLMAGKLIGIAAVGLTMPAIFMVGGGVMSLLTADAESAISLIFGYLFSSPLPLIYLFYFFCAYAIFSMVFLAIGAVSNSLQDAQSYMGPLMLIVFAPLPFMLLVFQNPNGLVATILTWIPIYTPYAVLLRAASDPPMWEIVSATLLMLLFASLLARAMGRIFRNSILKSSPTKARDLVRLFGKDVA